MRYTPGKLQPFDNIRIRIANAENEILISFKNDPPTVKEFLQTITNMPFHPGEKVFEVEIIGTDSGTVYFQGTIAEMLAIVKGEQG